MPYSSRPGPGTILKSARVPALLVTNLKNIAYLTAVDVSYGFLLIEAKKMTLFVDGRYLEIARETARTQVHILPIDQWQKVLCTLRKVGYESEDVTVSRLILWKRKYKNTKFVQTSQIIEQFRRSKYPDELGKIKKACSISLSVLRKMPKMLYEGQTELDLAWKIESACRAQGAQKMAFETIVAFAEHTARPHHHPTEKKLKRGDIVQVDMGAEYCGYASDYSRVYFYDCKPTPEQNKALIALKKTKKIAESLIKVGVTNRELDIAARLSLKISGYEHEFCHSLGHGVGLDIHEGVTLSSKAPKLLLQNNEVITIEPGLYFEGKFGMRIEDTIVVTDKKGAK